MHWATGKEEKQREQWRCPACREKGISVRCWGKPACGQHLLEGRVAQRTQSLKKPSHHLTQQFKTIFPKQKKKKKIRHVAKECTGAVSSLAAAWHGGSGSRETSANGGDLLLGAIKVF